MEEVEVAEEGILVGEEVEEEEAAMIQSLEAMECSSSAIRISRIELLSHLALLAPQHFSLEPHPHAFCPPISAAAHPCKVHLALSFAYPGTQDQHKDV